MKTILVIEDDREQQKILAEKLEPEKFRLLKAFDGSEGWNLIQKDKPDLIILDIMLPGGMNGFDFLEKLKREASYKNIPVIVLTNLDTERKTSKTIGATDYLIKSDTSINDLVNKIKTHLFN